MLLSHSIVGRIKHGDNCIALIRLFLDNRGDLSSEDGTQASDLLRSQCTSWLDEAASLLHRQWPRGGSGSDYSSKIVNNHLASSNTNHNYSLPCSFILIRENSHQSATDNDECLEGTVLGHGRLTECFESAGGNAAAATFIVISEAFRGQGWGRHLMTLLGKEAERLGYHYVYLWTQTAIGFYQRLGYRITTRVSLRRDCLKKLDTEHVVKLEEMLSQRFKTNIHTTTDNQSTSWKPPNRETILLPTSDAEDKNTSHPDVWMRKRLVEHVESRLIPRVDRLAELQEAVEQFQEKHGELFQSAGGYYCFTNIPWQPQIGPSCGLAALRMVREYYLNGKDEGEDGEMAQLPSLLGLAQERSYTHDGEIFDAHHLLDLAQRDCGLPCRIVSISHDFKPQHIWETLQSDGLWIIPYDSNAGTRLPAKLDGKGSHYGVVVGMLVLVDKQRLENKDSLPELQQTSLAEMPFDFFQQTTDVLSDTILLLVQHSLSPHFSIAPWKEFVESNLQINTIDQDKFSTEQANLDLKERVLLFSGNPA